MNRSLDRIPRLTVDIGPRRLPVFRSLGIIGFQVAVGSMVLVALVAGLPLVTALGISAVAGLSFFAWGLLRRALTGRETLVLIEYVWVALGLVVAYLWASGGPIVAGLDAMAVALCWFLAFGRLGCATAGCCHGVLASVGLRYGPEHGLAPRLTDRRLLPVQLIEATGLVAIGAVGLCLVATRGPAGRATVWFLVAYALLRFGCEALRGDERPVWRGVPVARAMCVVQAATGIVAAEAWLVPGPPGRAAAVGGAALAAAVVAGAGLTAARGRDRLAAAAHLDEVWELIWSLAADTDVVSPIVATTSLGMHVAVSDEPDGLHVSLSHPELPTVGAGRALAPQRAVEQRGITHVSLPWPSVSPAPLPVVEATADRSYFERASG